MLGDTPEVAVELLVPVGERPQLGQVLDLIDVAGTQAAAVGFLEGDEVVVGEQFADPLQVGRPPRVGQQVLPTAGQVVAVALGADTDLDVEAEKAQAAVVGQLPRIVTGGFTRGSQLPATRGSRCQRRNMPNHLAYFLAAARSFSIR